MKKTLKIGARILRLSEQIYCPETIITMLWSYAPKSFAEQFNLFKVHYDGIATMENFAGTTTEITLQHHHTWGCPVYILDEILQSNIAGISKWKHLSHAETYIGHSLFYARSVYLVINSQLRAVFNDEFYTVPFIREGKMPPNWIDIVKRKSHSGTPENIGFRDTWFTPYLDEYPRKTSSCDLIVTPENNKNGLMLSQTVPHVQ